MMIKYSNANSLELGRDIWTKEKFVDIRLKIEIRGKRLVNKWKEK